MDVAKVVVNTHTAPLVLILSTACMHNICVIHIAQPCVVSVH